MTQLTFSTLFSAAAQHTSASVQINTLAGEPCNVPFPTLVADAQHLVAKLQSLGVAQNTVVGLMLPNSYEYMLWDLALMAIGAVSCVLPVEIPSDDLHKITADTLAFGICAADNPLITQHKTAGCQWLTHEALLAQSAEAAFATEQYCADNSDILTYTFSSGSSGYLKGLTISRKGTERLVSNFIRDFALSAADSHLIFLPFSSFQQRLSLYACLCSGMSFAVTTFDGLFRELKQFAPSFIIAPPAVYENVHRAFAVPADANDDTKTTIKRTVQGFFGGNMRFMITGMAAIPPKVLHTYQDDFDIALLEAYGVTETGMIAWNTTDRNKIGSVGQPIVAEEVTLSAENEVIIYRDTPLCLGYFYCREDDQQNTFLADGGIATGDIGQIDEQGFLTLSGRKKELIVTDAGVKLQPEEIEKQLSHYDGFIQNVVLWCDKRKGLIAVVVVDEQTLATNKATLQRCIDDYNAKAVSYKKLIDAVFTASPFSIDNGLLTRNMKLARKQIHAAYVAESVAV